MSTQVKIQIPIDKTVRDKLEKRAASLGFDSAQAYIRVWAKAEVDGRTLDFGEDDWGQPTAQAAARLNKITDEAARGINVSEPFYTAREAMKHLNNL